MKHRDIEPKVLLFIMKFLCMWYVYNVHVFIIHICFQKFYESIYTYTIYVLSRGQKNMWVRHLWLFWVTIQLMLLLLYRVHPGKRIPNIHISPETWCLVAWRDPSGATAISMLSTRSHRDQVKRRHIFLQEKKPQFLADVLAFLLRLGWRWPEIF